MIVENTKYLFNMVHPEYSSKCICIVCMYVCFLFMLVCMFSVYVCVYVFCLCQYVCM